MSAPQRPARERVSDADPEVRYRAVLELEASPEALALLLPRLGDENWRVRKAAVERLVALPEPGTAVEALVARLADPDDAGGRNAAAEALARIGGPAIAALSTRIKDPDADLRKFAADVLGETKDSAAIPSLVEALRDGDQNVRISAAEALGKIGGSEAAGALEQTLDASDGLLKSAALDALARIGCSPPVGVLAGLVRDRYLQRAVLRLLANVPGRAAIELIADCLKEGSRSTREEAFAALSAQLERTRDKGQSIARSIVSTLQPPTRLADLARETLGAANERAVEGAVRVLGFVGEPSDGPAIAAAAGERLHQVAVVAIQSLGPPAAAPLLEALDELEPEGRLVAIEALARLREWAALGAMVELTREGSEEERLLAVEALGALGDVGAIPALVGLLEQRDLAPAAARSLVTLGKSEPSAVLAAVRAALGGAAAPWAIRVVGDLGTPEDLPLLKGALRSERTEVRLAATEAALAFGNPGTEEMLRLALADEAPEVRAGAARGLGGYGTEEAFSALIVALEDREPTVAAAAAQALGSLGEPSAAEPLARLLSLGEKAPGTPEVLPAVAATRALARLHAATPDLLLRAAAHPDPEVIKEAVEAAVALAGAEEVLLTAARDRRWDVRRAAARAIGMRGERALLGTLRELAAAEKDELVQESFEEALRALEARPLPREG